MAKTDKATKEGAAQDPNLPLFYKEPRPLDSKQHADLGLKKDIGFGFTKEVNAVPVNLIEMPQICHAYPIAFSPDEASTPVAILGLRDSENLFLDKKDKWISNTYIPAYIRRYPFIFSEMSDGDQLTLCVDMADGVVDKKSDQKFFDDKGEATELASNALEFCKSYHAAAQQTLEFSKALNDHDLLIMREAQISVGKDTKINFSGFKIVDEKKLAELDDKVFLEFRTKGWLPFLYAHLFSGAQWQRLSSLLSDRIDKK